MAVLMSDAKLDLGAMIREVLAEGTFQEPGKIADEVVDRLQDDQLREALRLTLPDLVRTVFHGERTGFGASGRKSMPTRSRSTTKANPSSKVTGIREIARLRRLAAPVRCAKGWKQLGHCTSDDVRYAAAERRRQAAANETQARMFDEYDRLLAKHSVTLVSEIPPDELDALWETPAA